jgi:hypothetical protein
LPVQGIHEANLSKVLFTDSTIVAASFSNGIVVRALQGGPWVQTFSGKNFTEMVRATDVVIAVAWPNLYRSFDNGFTWDTVPVPFCINRDRIAVIDSVIFMSGSVDVFRSDDYGTTFYSVLNNLSGLYSAEVFASNETVIIYSKWPVQVFLSENLGQSWYALSMSGFPTPNPVCNDIFRYGNRLWFASAGELLWANMVCGGWHHVSDTLRFDQMGEAFGKLHACGLCGFYQYDQLNDKWVIQNDGIEYHEFQTFDGSDSMLLAASYTEPFTCDSTYSWESCIGDLNHATIYEIASDNEEAWALTRKYLYHSTDHGSTFERINLIKYSPFTTLYADSSVIYVIAHNYLLESWNNGIHWIVQVPNPPETFSDIAVNQDYLFTRNQWYLFRTSRFEIDWHVLDVQGLHYYGYLAANDTVFIVSGAPDFFSADPSVFISYDQGESFTPLMQFPYLGSSPYTTFQDETFIVFHYQPYLSADGGATWFGLPFNISDFDAYSLVYHYPMMGVSGFSYNQFYFQWTTNQGSSWEEITDNLEINFFSFVSHIALSGTRLFAALRGKGLWYRDDLITSGTEKNPHTNNDQITIYPNPASGQVTITIGTDLHGYLLSLYDCTGRLILSQEIKSREFSLIKSLTKGVYTMAITTENRLVKTHKLIVY